MKKVLFASLLAATVMCTLPACDSRREDAAEEMEDAADDADAPAAEEAADRAEDAAD